MFIIGAQNTPPFVVHTKELAEQILTYLEANSKNIKPHIIPFPDMERMLIDYGGGMTARVKEWEGTISELRFAFYPQHLYDVVNDLNNSMLAAQHSDFGAGGPYVKIYGYRFIYVIDLDVAKELLAMIKARFGDIAASANEVFEVFGEWAGQEHPHIYRPKPKSNTVERM